MRTYNWEDLKKKALKVIPTSLELQQDGVATYLSLYAVLQGKSNHQGRKEILEDIREEMKTIILRWDIRNFRTLINLCGDKGVFIISSYKTKGSLLEQFVPELGESGEWELIDTNSYMTE